MKRAEIIIGLIALLAIISNLFMVPFSGVLTVLSLSALSVIYFYFGIALFNDIPVRQILKKEAYQGISKKRIVGSVASGIMLSIAFIAILFKIQSWPFAVEHSITSLIGMLIILLIASLKFYKTKSKFYINLFKRIAIVGGVVLFLSLLPDGALSAFKYRNYPTYVQALEDWRQDPNNELLRDKVDEEFENMLKE